MTIVAAIARDGEIVMAADTATNYQGTRIDGAVKIRRLDFVGEPILLAADGDGALVGLVQRNLKLGELSAPAVDDVQQLADAIASAATDIIASQTPPLLDEDRIDGAFLLGWRGQLWYLFTHQAVLVADGIAALGSGTDVALGAMHTALIQGVEAEQSTRIAVNLACRFAEGCAVGGAGPLVAWCR